MEYRNLGKEQIKVSSLGLGCYSIGTWLDKRAAQNLIDSAIDLGINFFDTADAYGGGKSEEILGESLGNRRPQVIIATKFGRRIKGEFNIPEQYGDYCASSQYIIKAVDNSLSRLRTDYIDLYQLHHPDPFTPIEETLTTLYGLIQAGKVRYIGCSNFNTSQLVEAMETGRKTGLISFSTTQELYNLIDREIEKELLLSYDNYGLGLIPFRPLRNGFLAGVYKRGQGIPEGTRYAVKPELLINDMSNTMRESFFSDRNFDILERLQDFAENRLHTVAELSIAWLLSRPVVCSVIAGAENKAQLMMNIKGSDWKLSAEELNEVNLLIGNY